MVVDSVEIIVKAGNGGNGASTFRRDGMTAKGGPNGGDGGNGGSVYVIGSTNITDLREFRYKKKIVADNGGNGTTHNGFGKNAQSITILLPIGTEVTNTATQESFEITNGTDTHLIARGGKGGRGNFAFKSATNQAPTYRELGQAGEEKTIALDLRFIADVGLVGLPNAGKSSLLSVLTNATPEIAAYPFTTLSPNIGMMDGIAIADIPGLIEGASSGKGLGMHFLRHIEKTKLLVHCIDVTVDDIQYAYRTVRDEFTKYSTDLADKPEIIFLNKVDIGDTAVVEEAERKFTKEHKKVFVGSLYNAESIEKLKEYIVQTLSHIVSV